MIPEKNSSMKKQTTNSNKNRIPAIFGEVLFDIFPDGNQVLGGAPFNVAWHLQGFGAQPLMISAVGDDELGRDIHDRMRSWGMNTSGIQVDKKHPTGVVRVSMNQGDPSYEVVRDSAWDFIQAGPALDAIKSQQVSILYHGSLAARSNTSSQTLTSTRKTTDAPVFIDINLRPPYWHRDLINNLLSGASWIKLNQSELELLSNNTSDPSRSGINLLNEHGAEWVITTKGAEGAEITSGLFGTLRKEPPPVKGLVDTVGAGDAFSAVVICGLAYRWHPALILERAVEFAADICRIQGATTNNKEIYTHHLEQWKAGDTDL